jgi:quercetin dioxygenase-like cupin family protein
MRASYSPTVVSPLPGSVAAGDAALKLWGDEGSGFVNDWIYVSNDRIQQLLFSMAPGTRFGHSEQYRTNMGADEIFYVLSGVLLLANPETGEVHRLEAGDAAWFGPDTWHHGFSQGTETLRALEFFAPPPATGSSQPYANTKPYLSEPRYARDEWIGRWPAAAEEAAAAETQYVIRPEQVMWRVEGREQPILVGIYLSTEQLTAGCIELLPGQRSDSRTHGGDLAGYVLEGRLNLCILDPGGNPRARQWFQSDEEDGIFVPAGTVYQLFNMTDRPVRMMFGVAPTYLPEAG